MEVKNSFLTRLEYSLKKRLILIDEAFFSKKETILMNLQISGGMDSMCLLHAMQKIFYWRLFTPKNKFFIVAQHFNHQMRERESAEDAAFVVQACLGYGIPIYQEVLNQKELKNLNFQNGARNWRKKKATELCNSLSHQLGCKKYFIVTAHHARDHVETVLMHILRGSALQGLMGIQEFDQEKNYFRPFFNIEYEDLEQYCLFEKIKFRVDTSNLKNDYQRNYIRNQILPHFKKLQNRYQKSFFSLSQQVRQQLQFLNDRAHKVSVASDVIARGLSSQALYTFLISKEKMLSQILTQNVVANILHELELMYKNKILQKEISMGLGWIVRLTFRSNLVYGDVFWQKKHTNELEIS
jgi:tRNA(Ile)-lysidine synthetase-like protein